MFEKATRQKVRFAYKGMATVEDLWDIPLGNLDEMFKALNAQAKAQSEESLLETKTIGASLLDLKISLVKHVVKTRLAEAAIETAAREKAEKKQKILGIIAEKQDEGLRNMSVDELSDMIKDM